MKKLLSLLLVLCCGVAYAEEKCGSNCHCGQTTCNSCHNSCGNSSCCNKSEEKQAQDDSKCPANNQKPKPAATPAKPK